jgi:hypothetical protein
MPPDQHLRPPDSFSQSRREFRDQSAYAADTPPCPVEHAVSQKTRSIGQWASG